MHMKALWMRKSRLTRRKTRFKSCEQQSRIQLAQSQFIANLNAEGDDEFKGQIKQKMLEVVSAPAASVFAVAPVADPADDTADDQRASGCSEFGSEELCDRGYTVNELLAEPRHDTPGPRRP
ncbi:hypothetical protein E4U13_000026 [Claviceps humidiphila]|uniref:Uncharacterized protein n=1 Tax=Claviceps humidiphila TaxID=1294629 RepID=A0A9P7QAP1_9HYPO|nr:hypothetical protein E4U13_000026 [Claviceps humidiphila]